jgi:hypothetical protein
MYGLTDVWNERLIPLHETAMEYARQFEWFKIVHVVAGDNVLALDLARMALKHSECRHRIMSHRTVLE